MAFIGEINHGVTVADPMPSGLLAMVGEDGEHYALAFPNGQAFALDHAESATTVWTLSQAQWRLDAAGLSMGYTGTPDIKTAWGAPGTPVFYVAGYIIKDGFFEVIIVRYRIVDSSTINVDVPFRYTTLGYTGVPEYPVGVGTIGTMCYAFSTTFGNTIDFNNTFKTHCIALPTDGTGEVDASSESWEHHITELPWEWGAFRSAGSAGRPYYNRVCVIEMADGGVRGDFYVGQTEVDDNGGGISPTIAALSGPSMLSTIVYPDTHIATPSTNVSSSYGLPFSDIGLDYANGPGTARDDYSAPYQCSDGKLRMARPFSDEQKGRSREFTINSTTGAITVGAVSDWVLRVDPIAGSQTREFIQVFRDGTDNHWMLWADEYYAFGFIEDEEEPEEPDTEDEGEDNPCLFDWDECLLIPEHITIEIVAPTVSPGRSLTGREVVVQPDAGSFRVILHDIAVWSEEALLKWREYESTLNGRVGTCCVPLYEAKLSATPIAATLGADAAAGAVRLTITQTAGFTIRAGMHFQAGERAYRLISGSGSAWKVWPPLRSAITSGTSLNFNDPRLRCRLETDDGMDIMLELLKFGRVTVNFVEDV